MSARLIDGQAIAAAIRDDVRGRAEALRAAHGYTPGLATVLVGDNPASATYVRMKQKACAGLGLRSVPHVLPADARQPEVQRLVEALNADPSIDGILVQLPLPGHLDEESILSAIDLEKDVDGFHPINIGRLAMRNRTPLFIPCTPFGILRLLEETGVTLRGADAVVVGRSNIVGLPAAMVLQKADATVTLCHRHTRHLARHLRHADIVVVAVGQPELVTGDMLKPGAVVIDVGINRKPDASRPNGYRIVGDVDFESARAVAGAITPVPGGVGPMTIAMLMHNTLRAAERHAERQRLATLLPAT
ncbi:bifunctional methylenetetrahydrofolate dehydrogenase/methenyltetrahydrofolate cyclohydrolase FolD [bacterium]|nr:MAG: bifunctional methylenetetrahydrofolate dehydrogenase/methenyltetrahydrofolate cyclohydrolase FolD [bacterium]